MKQRLIGLSLVLILLVLWSSTVWGKNSETPAAWINLQYSLIRSGFDRDISKRCLMTLELSFFPMWLPR